MKLFFGYLRYRWRVITVFFAFAVIFTVVFLLYSLPLGAVLYPFALCFIAGAIASVCDYLRIKKRHMKLEGMKKLSGETLPSVSEADSIAEQDLNCIIENLKKEIYELKTDSDIRYREMTDYYSVWAHQIKKLR